MFGNPIQPTLFNTHVGSILRILSQRPFVHAPIRPMFSSSHSRSTQSDRSDGNNYHQVVDPIVVVDPIEWSQGPRPKQWVCQGCSRIHTSQADCLKCCHEHPDKMIHIHTKKRKRGNHSKKKKTKKKRKRDNTIRC